MYGWKHVWMEFAEEFQGTVEDLNPDSSQTGMSIVLPLKNTDLTLVYTLEPGKNGSHSHTTVEASFSAGGDLKFGLHPQKQLVALGKLFGMQDIVVGFKDFDQRFVIKGNVAGRIRDIFADGEIRALLMDEPNIEISSHANNTDSKLSPKVLDGEQFVLSLKIPSIIDDFERLKNLYRLTELLLANLCAEESAVTMPVSMQAPNFS